jgi:hypothetical protein
VRRAALVVLLSLASCSESAPAETPAAADSSAVSDTNVTVDDTSVAVDTGTPTPSDVATDTDLFGAYPAGPYGNKLGDVVANLAWEGHVSPLADALANTKPYVTTSMDQLRRDAKKGYALVHVSEFY